MKKLDCRHVDITYLNDSSIKLNLDYITDGELPTVSVVTPTRNRSHFIDLMIRNWNRIDYPIEKIEWIILDDSDKQSIDVETKLKNARNSDKIRYIKDAGPMTIGYKRNKLAELANNEYIVHMDDDDWYPPESVSARIRILLDHQKKIKDPLGCFGCTKSLCIDLITNQMFEAYDPSDSPDGAPATVSESTMAYSKKYWQLQKFNDECKMTECLDFIKDRDSTVCSGPSVFIIVQFSHTNNTVNRRVKRDILSQTNGYRFIKGMSTYDSSVYDKTRAVVLKEIPSFRESIKMIEESKHMTLNKFRNFVRTLGKDVLQNPLFIDYMRVKLKSKETSTGKDVVYYCGPGNYLHFTSAWNPESEILGGSEEAVITLSFELASRGYNVTVYCVLPESSKKTYTDSKFNKVNYRNYWEWSPYDINDYNIIWRDPSNCSLCKNGKTFLDLHDALDPTYLESVPTGVEIMVKSKYHQQLLRSGLNMRIIPNGIYPIDSTNKNIQKNMMLCTSSPDRCLGSLLRMLPIIRTEIPDAEIHWAYGFKSGIAKGGLENDNRPEVKQWTQFIKKLILETEGFVDLGRLNQKDIGNLYLRADLFVYPTRFPEIDCISLTKAMSAGAVPVVTPAGAMAEKMSIKFQCAQNVSNIDSSLESGALFDNYVKEVIKTLKNERKNTDSMQKKTNEKYNWSTITDQWVKYF